MYRTLLANFKKNFNLLKNQECKKYFIKKRSKMETYLIKIEQLIPQRLVEHRPAPFGGNDDPPKFSRPRQPRGLKIGIVDFEVMLKDGSLVLGLAVGRREEVLGVVVVVHLLEAGRA